MTPLVADTITSISSIELVSATGGVDNSALVTSERR